MRQLTLNLSACAACQAGRRHDATHDPGCQHRWLTFGEQFDLMQPDQQRRLYTVTARGESFEDYSAGLWRGRTA